MSAMNPKVKRDIWNKNIMMCHGKYFQVLDATPKLANCVERTRKVPNIKKWLEERPATEF